MKSVKLENMKKVLLIVGFSCFSLLICAQPATDAAANTTEVKKAAEESLVIKEEVYDFGKIPQGKPVHHVFVISNIGKTPLKLANVQASCGCTTPEWERNKVQAPGEKTRINVGYNAAAEGPFTKTITITYNGTQTRMITIKGEVWKTPASSAPENKDLKGLKEE